MTAPAFHAAQPPDALSLRRYGASHGSHAHDHFQVLLGLDGLLELEVDGRGTRVATGEGCVIAPGSRHDFESPAGARCLVLDSADNGWANCHPQPARRGQAMSLARFFAQALQQPGGQLPPQAAGLLLQAWRPAQSSAPRNLRDRRMIDWLGLSRWAGARLHENLGVASLAKQVFLSPTQFAARCREETGLSAMHWLRDLRLTRARQLRALGVSVAETAWRCGYQSPSALTAALRRDEMVWRLPD
ncbi:MAG: AraC family transcriptional regulator [Comamonadaceae bacterium]|nr:MAG: AraC family transcriptional regulator [Comamonadaceae bacterium]